MKKVAAVAMLAFAASTAAGLAADLKAPPPAPPPSPWDFAFGSGLMSDYNFRGITQSAHKPSVAAYFEPRYNITSSLQAYAGVAGESIDFPNRASMELDVYGGIRPTFDKLALDFGIWYYGYPGGQCFNDLAVGGPGCTAASAFQDYLPNGNVVKQDVSFYEVYAKATYTVSDNFSFGGSVFYSPNVLNSGADGTYVAGTIKYIVPNAPLPKDSGRVRLRRPRLLVPRHQRFVLLHPGCRRLRRGIPERHPLQELHQLGRRRRLHLQGLHARPALFRHQPEQGRLQRLHQRSHGDRHRDHADQSVPGAWLQLVRLGFVAKFSVDMTAVANLK